MSRDTFDGVYTSYTLPNPTTREQVERAVEEGADYIVGETFSEFGEAMFALECIKKYGNDIPAAISLTPHAKDTTFDDLPFGPVCRKLEEAGAAAVGLNCARGPQTMMPLVRKIRQACKGPIMALPVAYRTCAEMSVFQYLKDPITGDMAFPVDLPAHACSRNQICQFAKEAKEIGVEYVGLCCGNASHYIRVVAEVYGRRPPASRFSPDMTKHFVFENEYYASA